VVRQIACDTADAGGPVERFFHDRQAFADILTRYYTDYEPGSLWVADCDGLVAGYLTGCLDTRRQERVTRRQILPKVILSAIARGVLWHDDAWRLLAAFIGTVALSGFPHRIDLTAYPAHFHINIREGFRGGGLGPQLVEAFRQQAVAMGLPVRIAFLTYGDFYEFSFIVYEKRHALLPLEPAQSFLRPGDGLSRTRRTAQT